MSDRARWRTAVTVLIAAASLLGALATWRLTKVSGEAGGADARAVEDTITRQQNRTSALVVAREEAGAFARVKGYESAAASLDRLAAESLAAGNGDVSRELRTTGQTLRELAIDLLDRYGALRDVRYVGKAQARFDVSRRRTDLELNTERATRNFPAPRSATNDALGAHDHSRELGLAILAFASAIFLFALAEKLREHLDPVLAIAGTVLLAAATVGLVLVW